MLNNPTASPTWLHHKMTKTAAYYAAFIAIGLASASLGPTLPNLAENTHTTLSQISNLFMARSLGYVFGSLFTGRLYDRWLGHPIMAVAAFFSAAIFMVVPLVTHLWLLMAILFLVGLNEGAVDVGGNTLIVWLHGREVGPFMNGLHLFFGIGAFIAPLIVAQSLNWTGDITAAYWSFGLLVLPISLALALLPSPPVRHSNHEEANAEPTNYRLVGLFTLFFFLYVGMEITLGGWISTYALQLNLTTEANAALLASAFWGSFTFGRLIAIPLAFRLRPRTILITDLVGTFLSLMLMLLWPTSLIAVGIGAMGVGVSVASMFPTMLSFAGRRINITAQVTSIFFLGASLGSMFLPFLMGRIIENFGPMALLWAIFADLMLAIALFTFLMRYSANVVEK